MFASNLDALGEKKLLLTDSWIGG